MNSKKWFYLALFFLVSWLILTKNWECSRKYTPDKLFTIFQLQDDLHSLRNIIQEQHPALHYYNYNREFESFADSLEHSLTKAMTVKDFYFHLGPLIEKVNCGHTKIYLPDHYWIREDSSLNILPIRFYFQDNRIWCRQNNSYNDQIEPGMEILKVNHLSSAQIIENFIQRISTDGFNETYKYAQMNRRAYGLFPGYPDFPNEYDIICKKPGNSNKKKIHLKAIPLLPESHTLPISEALSDYPFRFEVIDSLNTGIMRVGIFVPDDELKYNDFIHNSFRKIRDLNLSHLILDVRDNDGGDPNHAALLLTYLLSDPFVYFNNDVYGYNHLTKPMDPVDLLYSGPLYILMDGGCFSTTGHLLSILREYRRGTFIGEETGGSFLCFGCPDELILPETKLRLNYMRCTFATSISSGNLGQGLKPDYPARPRIADLISGKDTILSKAINLIRQQPGK